MYVNKNQPAVCIIPCLSYNLIWPIDIDGTNAKNDWGWIPKYSFEKTFSEYLIPKIKERYSKQLTFTHTQPRIPTMVECKHRIPVDPKDNNGIGKAVSRAVAMPSAFAGQSLQSFQHGLCALLTQNDFGPIACLQPQHNEETCPDIKE